MLDKDIDIGTLRIVISAMREKLESIGYRFTPSFKECIEIVRQQKAQEGVFMSYEECAFRVLEGGFKANGLPVYKYEEEDQPETETD